MTENPLRGLPSVHQVLQDPASAELISRYGAAAVADAARAELDERRQLLRSGKPVDADHFDVCMLQRLQRRESPKLRPVINATGIILHTNLGRAPLAEEAARAAYEAGCGALNLEIDLDTGLRSSRQDAIRTWMHRLLGAESATAVNNCAAATVIVLRALAQGREVIVSRGQLVEIGGSFRIPEIMAASGALLREVGTTNITRIDDYEQAIDSNTGLLLRVHQSNYRIRGFTSAPDIAELVALGRKHNVPVVDDIGSGALVDFARFGLLGEPLAVKSLEAGVDLVLFSGDKLMGGPQAGLIAGRADLIKQIENDPLMRAFRLDKMTLAALEATLRLYLRPDLLLDRIPVLQLLSVPLADLMARAQALAVRINATAREDVTYVGGGSLPDQTMPTAVVAFKPAQGADAFARCLRLGSPAILTRIANDEVIVDLRSVSAEQDAAIADLIIHLLTVR